MSNTLIAFLVAVSASVWIYTKLMRSSGNNTKNASILSVVLGVVIFFIAFMLLKLIPKA